MVASAPQESDSMPYLSLSALRQSLPLVGGGLAVGTAVVLALAPGVRPAAATASPRTGRAIAPPSDSGTELFITGGYCTLPARRDSSWESRSVPPAESTPGWDSDRPARHAATLPSDTVCTGKESAGGAPPRQPR